MSSKLGYTHDTYIQVPQVLTWPLLYFWSLKRDKSEPNLTTLKKIVLMFVKPKDKERGVLQLNLNPKVL